MKANIFNRELGRLKGSWPGSMVFFKTLLLDAAFYVIVLGSFLLLSRYISSVTSKLPEPDSMSREMALKTLSSVIPQAFAGIIIMAIVMLVVFAVLKGAIWEMIRGRMIAYADVKGYLMISLLIVLFSFVYAGISLMLKTGIAAYFFLVFPIILFCLAVSIFKTFSRYKSMKRSISRGLLDTLILLFPVLVLSGLVAVTSLVSKNPILSVIISALLYSVYVLLLRATMQSHAFMVFIVISSYVIINLIAFPLLSLIPLQNLVYLISGGIALGFVTWLRFYLIELEK